MKLGYVSRVTRNLLKLQLLLKLTDILAPPGAIGWKGSFLPTDNTRGPKRWRGWRNLFHRRLKCEISVVVHLFKKMDWKAFSGYIGEKDVACLEKWNVLLH